MELILKVIVWMCVGAIVYNYVGYPILLYLAGMVVQGKSDLSFIVNRRDRRQSRSHNFEPSIAIIVSAFNEEAVIEARIRNLLAIKYPSHLVEILIGLDSPTDGTSKILTQFRSPRLTVVEFSSRRGKLAVIHDLAHRTRAEILVFTDANTIFDPDCVSNLVRHFHDTKVGAVCGEEVRISAGGTDPAAERGYWRYECALKILESRAGCLHSANGGVYAIRRQLFQPSSNLLVEDFQVPLELRFRGYQILYDPAALAIEEIAPSLNSQFERRVRLGAGNFQTLFSKPGYLNPFKGRPAFAYWSHRVLRWLTPLLLILLQFSTVGLVLIPLYRFLFVGQCAFYLAALAGCYKRAKPNRAGIWRAPFNFCSMNLALLFGLYRYLAGRQSLAWVATPRQAAVKVRPSQYR